MRTFLRFLAILLLNISFVSAQIYENTDYVSNRTSFQDFNNSGNNFIEDAQYNLTIQIQDNEGIILIQDPRISEKPLIYRIYSKGKKVSNTSTNAIFYNAYIEHVETPQKTYIGIYKSKDKSLNLMVEDSLSSQVFHNLKPK